MFESAHMLINENGNIDSIVTDDGETYPIESTLSVEAANSANAAAAEARGQSKRIAEAEKARVIAEGARVKAEEARDAAQRKNNADQAANNAASLDAAKTATDFIRRDGAEVVVMDYADGAGCRLSVNPDGTYIACSGKQIAAIYGDRFAFIAPVINTASGDIMVSDLYEAVGGWERSY